MDANRFIKVTGVDVRELIAMAFQMSDGLIANPETYRPGPISKEAMEDIMGSYRVNIEHGCVLSVAETLGRTVNLAIWKHGDDLWIENVWPSHTEDQFKELEAWIANYRPEPEELPDRP